MSRISLDKRMHQQLLDMLGAKDQEDAARIIASFHGSHLSAQAKVRVTEAVPNDDWNFHFVREHNLFVYEVDFGDEGKGRYIRLSDFNKVCESFATRLSQGAQVSISDALNRLEDMAVAGEHLHGDDVPRFRATADKIAPQGAQGEAATENHLSAQAKVRVTDEDVVRAIEAFNTFQQFEHRSSPTLTVYESGAMHESLQSLAARLSQGAQGESHEGKQQWDQLASILGADGDNVDQVFRKARELVAERAAVPCPHCHNGKQGYMECYSCDGSGKFAAAPQPPEGARVVDERYVLGYFSADPAEGEFNRHETLEAARQAAEGLLESAGDEAADWGWADDPPQICYGVVLGGCEVESRDVAPKGSDFEELVNYRVFGPGAAPTLAGKEGAK